MPTVLRLICTLALPGLVAVALPAENAATSAAERFARLNAEIARHDELYFREARPEITDAEYDALKQELRALLENDPSLAGTRAGLDALTSDDRTDRFPTAQHRRPMQGLEKSFREAELRRFVARVTAAAGGAPVALVVEPKYDGLAISLVYENGRLLRAVTRGNGHEGDVVTDNLLACTAVPRALRAAPGGPAWPGFVEIRGEVFMEPAEFRRLNAERLAAGEPAHAHPRNLAVGTLKSSDPAVVESRRLAWVAYGCGAWEPAATAPASQRELLAWLGAWGLPVPPFRVGHDAESVWQLVRALEAGRAEFPAPLDGAVVKVDELALRTRLGDGGDAARGEIAHKFEPERAETRLRGIAWQVGRTGLLTPVAELEPVSIGGTVVARASLQNRREIERRDYRIGDLVRVQKAGDIIPQLAGVNPDARPPNAARYAVPEACPACGAALAVSETALRCPQRACPAQVKRRLEHFVGDSALNLRGFGPATIAALVEQAGVRDLHELYGVTAAQWRAVADARGGDPARLAAEIERSRRSEWWRVVNGLGLPGVGVAGARRLAGQFAGLRELQQATATELMRAGFTAAGAAALLAELRDPQMQATLDGLIAAGVAPAR